MNLWELLQHAKSELVAIELDPDSPVKVTPEKERVPEGKKPDPNWKPSKGTASFTPYGRLCNLKMGGETYGLSVGFWRDARPDELTGAVKVTGSGKRTVDLDAKSVRR